MSDNSIALQVQTPNMLQTLGNMTSTAQQMLNLKKSSATLGADIARTQAESKQAVGTAQPAIDTAVASAQQAQTGAAAAKYNLDKAQFQTVQDNLGALVQDPAFSNNDSKGQVDAVLAAKDRAINAGVPRAVAETGFAPILVSAQNHPEMTRGMLANIIRAGQGAGGQAAQELIPASGQATVGGTLGPQNVPAVVNKDQFGATSVGAAPIAGAPGTQPTVPNAPLTYPAGESPDTAAPLYHLRDTAQASAAAAPQQHFNNSQIIKLADTLTTGTGSGQLAKILNSVGIQSTNDIGADTARLQHFIAQQVESNASAQGANTDAARKMASDAVVPGSTPADALKSITKVNDAYVTGNELFNSGLNAAINNPNNPKGIFAARDFQNKWSQNFDPRIMQLENAVKNGDKAEVAAIKKELGPAGIKQLLTKAQALRALTMGGGNGP